MNRLLICLLVLASCQSQLTVIRVVDGDTMVLSNGAHMRLAGIDCPESSRNAKCRRGADCETEVIKGQSVKRQVNAMVNNAHATVLDQQDRYGRAVGYVTMSDGRDLGETLIAQGLCVDWSAQYPHPRAAQYKAAAN
jgi:micrococcal nuclease